MSGNKAVSERARTPISHWIIPMFFIVFGIFFMASVGLYLTVKKEVQEFKLTKNWVKVPCRILEISSEKISVRDKTNYKINVLYSYSYNGREFTSRRYNITGEGISDEKVVTEILMLYSSGNASHCYCNPEKPGHSVLVTKAKFNLDEYIGVFAFFSVGFVALLLFVIRYKVTDRRRKNLPLKPFSPRVAPAVTNEPITLKMSNTRGKRLLVVGATTLFSVLMTVVFFSSNGKSWDPEMSDTTLSIFRMVLSALTTGLSCVFIHKLLALTNPLPMVTLRSGLIYPGSTVKLRWCFNRSTRKIRNLKFLLEGVEQAENIHGKNTKYYSKTFSFAEFFSTQIPSEIPIGEVELKIPENTMPSFDSRYHHIRWSITVVGTIAIWPDIKDRFELFVYPHQSE